MARTAEQLRTSATRHNEDARQYASRARAAETAGEQQHADELWRLHEITSRWASEDEDELIDRFADEAW